MIEYKVVDCEEALELGWFVHDPRDDPSENRNALFKVEDGEAEFIMWEPSSEEPEDHTFNRDLYPLIRELNKLAEGVEDLEARIEMMEDEG